MAAWSMPLEMTHMECNKIIHNHQKSCLYALLPMARDTCKGAAVFITLVEVFGYLRKKALNRPATRKSAKELLESYLRFATFTFGKGCGALALSCAFRRLFGRYRRATFVLLPGMISSCSFAAIKDERLQLLFSFVFVNSSMSLLLKRAENKLRLSLRMKTALFMILSSVISSLLTKLRNPDYHFFWFFNPVHEKLANPDDSISCAHPGSCTRHVLNDVMKYLAAGVGLTLFNILFEKELFSRPLSVLKSLMHPQAFSLAFFFSFYSLIYQVVRCTLRRLQFTNNSRFPHDAFAGGLAGISFLFNPSTSFMNLAFITTAQILTRYGIKKKKIPNWPYPVIFYSLCSGLLLDAMFIPKDCPSLPQFAINTCTYGQTAMMLDNIKKSLVKN